MSTECELADLQAVQLQIMYCTGSWLRVANERSSAYERMLLSGRCRRGKSLFSSGKDCHLVLLGHFLYCYPVGDNKTPFSELDLSANAALSVSGSTSFTVKDQTWTTYSFNAATTEERNVWLSALQHVQGLSRWVFCRCQFLSLTTL